MNYLESIFAIRVELLIHQKELSNKVGVSFTTIKRLEKEKLVPFVLPKKKIKNFSYECRLQSK